MINLIPIEEQKKKVKSFYIRFIILFLFIVTFCVAVAAVALIPAYFLSVNKESVANLKLKNQNNEPTPELDKDTTALIRDLDNKLKIIESSEGNKFLVSQAIINQIYSSKMSDIKINRISFEKDVELGKVVSIYGNAPSRERLLLFREALEENTAFSKVDLPVSNFIKGSDIEFYLNLIAS